MHLTCPLLTYTNRNSNEGHSTSRESVELDVKKSKEGQSIKDSTKQKKATGSKIIEGETEPLGSRTPSFEDNPDTRKPRNKGQQK